MEPEAEKAGNDEAREEPGAEPGAGAGAEALPPGEKRCCGIATLYSVLCQPRFFLQVQSQKMECGRCVVVERADRYMRHLPQQLTRAEYRISSPRVC